MGCCQSFTAFSQEELQTYQKLTKLNQAEIIHAYHQFQAIDSSSFEWSKFGWISFVSVADTLPELAVNPFRYRITKIFCSTESGFMDFEDFLDLIAVMSDKGSLNDKLVYAFQIFDFNEDDALCTEDLSKVLDYITGGKLPDEPKERIIKTVLDEADSDGDGMMSFTEFERIMHTNAAPDFLENFRFTL